MYRITIYRLITLNELLSNVVIKCLCVRFTLFTYVSENSFHGDFFLGKRMREKRENERTNDRARRAIIHFCLNDNEKYFIIFIYFIIFNEKVWTSRKTRDRWNSPTEFDDLFDDIPMSNHFDYCVNIFRTKRLSIKYFDFAYTYLLYHFKINRRRVWESQDPIPIVTAWFGGIKAMVERFSLLILVLQFEEKTDFIILE